MSELIEYGKHYELVGEGATASFAERLAALLVPGITLGLVGELGAGKTTLARYLVKSLGSSEPVSSPTFVLSHEYKLSSGVIVEHWDLYRIKSLPDELRENCPASAIRIIEWADRASSDELRLDFVLHLFHGPWNEPEKRLAILEKAPMNAVK